MPSTERPRLGRDSRVLAGAVAVMWPAVWIAGALLADAELLSFRLCAGSFLWAVVVAVIPWESARLFTPGPWAALVFNDLARLPWLFWVGVMIGLVALPAGAAGFIGGIALAQVLDLSMVGAVASAFIVMLAGLGLGGIGTVVALSRRAAT